MNENKILQYGRLVLEKHPKIKIKVYDTDESQCEDIIKLIDSILVKEGIDINNYNKTHVIKVNEKGNGMNPHLDDYQLVKRKEIFYNQDQYIHLSNDWYLFRNKPEKPVFSCVYYMTTQGEDFTGGELVFINDIVSPKKGRLVIFDSEKFVHYVNPVKSGTRKSMLVKYYAK